ncbi:MAG: DUF4872 domain-containing protein [Solirubrobacterales bacterium]|nr:DUF4872 domain-containing protein [Solirubrobacterales bacterium]
MTGQTMVPGYRHVPGNHCGSTALRNLLAFHGAELTEEMAFGLGAGACFFYVALDGQSPSRFTNGRAAKLEENFLELTGAPLRLRTDPDPEASWQLAHHAVDSGRPALLLTDLYYLDHYGKSAHFPGHAVVIAGYDSEEALLSDTGFDELQTTKLENLAKARHSKQPILQLDGHIVDLPEGAALDAAALRETVPAAVARATEEMIEPALPEFQGLPALRKFATEVESWPEAAEDWQWCARFLFQVIERRGTGGGNFRKMYSRFLAEAGYEAAAPLASEAAKRWTAIAEAAGSASAGEDADPEEWAELRRCAESVLEAETALWESLAG